MDPVGSYSIWKFPTSCVSRTTPSSTTTEKEYAPRRNTLITVRGTVMCASPLRYSSMRIQPSSADPAHSTGANLFSATATYSFTRGRSATPTGSCVEGTHTIAVNDSVSPLMHFMSRRAVHGAFTPCGLSPAI